MKTVLIVVGILAVIVLAVAGGAAYYLTAGHGVQKLAQSKLFGQGFDKGFRKSCTDGAIKKGFSEEKANTFCECALAKYKAGTDIQVAAKQCSVEAAGVSQ